MHLTRTASVNLDHVPLDIPPDALPVAYFPTLNIQALQFCAHGYAAIYLIQNVS